MENLASLGRLLVGLGLAVALVGGVLWLLGRIPGLNNLPGTLRFQWSGITCIVPILASIVISVVLTIVVNVILRIINR